ncbi:Rha family transcriptional regulator [Pseudomonas sp. ArH3a]|uniref:Rha family transcriptional regulator n=1 Tax=Pseudomonas sp. ArH3a TaxID=2862945 RepID=UPI001F58BAF6|nr:Rha family transcriptional regulator [Pseudomonas sp. ArH3a]UNM18074.1 Rha family transcriptional regulator [Pseudomonas sp. ArH3a]
MTDLILTEDDYRQLVQSHDGKPTTDSLKVAEKFGKRHDTVLRSIDNLKCSEGFRLRNFVESSYINEQNKAQRMFTMTKDGFMFLVMGFTGKKAGTWKEAFIEAFNWMTDELTFRSLSYEQRRNYISLEYKQEMSLASFAGKTMRRWQIKKPIIEGEMMALEQSGQGSLQLH